MPDAEGAERVEGAEGGSVSNQLIQLDIQSDLDRMVKQMRADTRQVPKAINSTINKVATTIRKEGARDLAKETGIKQKKLRESLKLNRSTPRTLSASIDARGKPFNIASFNAKVKRAKKRPIGVTAKPWNKRRLFEGAFILNVKGSPVFKRTGKGGKGIKPVFGPSVVREFLRDKIIKSFNATGRRRFREVFPRELKFRMGKGGR